MERDLPRLLIVFLFLVLIFFVLLSSYTTIKNQPVGVFSGIAQSAATIVSSVSSGITTTNLPTSTTSIAVTTTTNAITTTVVKTTTSTQGSTTSAAKSCTTSTTTTSTTSSTTSTTVCKCSSVDVTCGSCNHCDGCSITLEDKICKDLVLSEGTYNTTKLGYDWSNGYCGGVSVTNPDFAFVESCCVLQHEKTHSCQYGQGKYQQACNEVNPDNTELTCLNGAYASYCVQKTGGGMDAAECKKLADRITFLKSDTAWETCLCNKSQKGIHQITDEDCAYCQKVCNQTADPTECSWVNRPNGPHNCDYNKKEFQAGICDIVPEDTAFA